MAWTARWLFGTMLLITAECFGQAVTVPATVMVDAGGKIQSATLRDHFDPQSSRINPHKAAQIVQLRQQLEGLKPGEMAALRLQLNALELDALQELLDQKQEEIDRLKFEVDELRRPHEQVLIQVSLRAIEVSRTKLRGLGVEADFLKLVGQTGTGRQWQQVVDDASELNTLVSELIEQDLARVIAEPTLALRNGRTGTFVSGGETPWMQVRGENVYSQRMIPFGTRVTMMPVLQQDGLVRLAFSFDFREIDRSLGYHKDKITAPGFRTRHFSTSAELRSGQTLVLSGMRTEKADGSAMGKLLKSPAEQWETMVLVRATFPVELDFMTK